MRRGESDPVVQRLTIEELQKGVTSRIRTKEDDRLAPPSFNRRNINAENIPEAVIVALGSLQG